MTAETPLFGDVGRREEHIEWGLRATADLDPFGMRKGEVDVRPGESSISPGDQAVLDDFAAFLRDPSSRCPLCLQPDHTNPRDCPEAAS